MGITNTTSGKSKSLVWMSVIYLLGLFIGAIDTGIITLPNNKADDTLPTDKLGTLLMTVIILSLLYGLKNLDFFDIANSITDSKVWPFLAVPLVLIPIFGLVEKLGPEIETVFQKTLNTGYKNMYMFQVFVNLFGLLVLLFYKEKKE